MHPKKIVVLLIFILTLNSSYASGCSGPDYEFISSKPRKPVVITKLKPQVNLLFANKAAQISIKGIIGKSDNQRKNVHLSSKILLFEDWITPDELTQLVTDKVESLDFIKVDMTEHTYLIIEDDCNWYEPGDYVIESIYRYKLDLETFSIDLSASSGGIDF